VLRTPDDGSRVVRFVLSDGSVDRMGDTIDPTGWQLSSYRKNPVCLWAHDSSAPPIGRTIAVWSDGTRLLGDIKFADSAVYPFADTIFKLLTAGYLQAGSVGFMPIEYDWSDDDERPFGLDFKRQELLEFSIVPVPANANALTEARSKGLLSSADMMRIRSSGYRRRDGTEGPWLGNCGRPIGDTCGLKDVAECSIHGQQGAGVGDDSGKKSTQQHDQEIQKWR
jgi:HK97 family phage prohead protease